MFYRFRNGVFIEADNFDEAKYKIISIIESEKEDKKRWYNCTCLGVSHRHGCPEMDGIIPY